ncbi:MAG TPA: plasma-membrane proton-efflux P-type ATPase [Candidatus Saccharimonadales bacterium]|nr:plasma-membrane proton-efflux P-type ATPase [Candidatus Saccharimonadales bacterium]
MNENYSAQGLDDAQAAALLQQYGPNTISAKQTPWFVKVVRWLVSPMSLLLLAAAALSFYIGKTFDGWFILALFVLNFAISRWHEAKADQAIAALQRRLSITVQVLRGGSWRQLPSEQLVPGDVVKLGVGNVVPADITLAEAKNLSINEAALTGESLPQDKEAGAIAYSGSFITTGSLLGTVAATGNRTKFGKTVTMVDTRPKHSSLEKDILRITQYLTAVSVLAGVVVTAVLLVKHQGLADLLTLDLSVLIAGIPVAMPTVMSLIISLGVLELTRKHVVVRRLSSLEDLANVNLLLSDKTGTLTSNRITVEQIVPYGGIAETDLMRWAASATTDNAFDLINQAILAKTGELKVSAYSQKDFTPADSKRKRSTAVVDVDGKTRVVSMGAPQVIAALCTVSPAVQKAFDRQVSAAAAEGYRSLALAIGDGTAEHGLRLIGLLELSDTLRPDAKQVIRFLRTNGITTKMMTGDNRAIAARVSKELGLTGVVTAAAGQTASLGADELQRTAVFAEVLPDDKYHIVQAAARSSTVAATGDGVNDLPALKLASVGIAVKNAVDALKSAADIVLLTDGISVIKDAIIEARKIFTRTYYYSVYRISESFRLILSIAILSVATGGFPLTPVQIILLALLNDLPIISLAYDRVHMAARPSVIHVRERFLLASMYGLVGVFTSITFFYLLRNAWHVPTAVIQTMFFLKLTVSGHLLIYVAHTRERWWKWLPARPVIWATVLTQLLATALALSGLFFQGISVRQAVFVWVWAFAWMQVAECVKWLFSRRFDIE